MGTKKFLGEEKISFFEKKMKKKFLDKFKKKNLFIDFFNIIVPYFDSNRFFQAKSLSYHTYSVISENLVEQFFRKFQKTVIVGQNGHFSAHLAKIDQNEKFYQKSGRAIFLPLLSPNFMPSFRKIVRAVSEINSLHTYIHPSIHAKVKP